MRRRRLTLGAVLIAVAALLVSVPTDAQPAVAAPAAQMMDPELASPEARAMATALRTGERVELTDQRTETGQVYANPDGTKTMEQHSQPVRVRKGRDWVAPDPTLKVEADGSIRPVATISPLVLSGGGDQNLVAIGKPGEQIRLGWPATLPKPELSGNIATYPSVFPGVDLQITAEVDRFSQLLVVHNREAAANPALATLSFPVSADGLTLRVNPDGTTSGTDKTGKLVYTADRPAMWDASSVEKPRFAKLAIRHEGGRFVITPDRKLLTDPAATYPLSIDPSISGTSVNWLHVNDESTQADGWTYDRTNGGAKVGPRYGEPDNVYRSMFLIRTVSGAQAIAGSTILSAQFRITLDWSSSGTAKPVGLWNLTDLDTANKNLHWATTTTYWKTLLDTQSGAAWPAEKTLPMEFGALDAASPLRTFVQSVANSRKPTLSLGLRSPNEGTSTEAQYHWKKFIPSSAVLAVKYNTAPKMPKGLSLTRPRPCGTAAAPTPVLTAQPQWASVADDPDLGDNVTTTLQIKDPAGAVVHESAVGPTVSGAAFAWPETPVGKLSNGVVYSYTAFTKDAANATSPTTPACYFVIDTSVPAVPRIESTDFPDAGDPVTEARKVGKVTFRPGASETDLDEYVYGFQADALVSRIKADPDGSATIPITVHPDPVTGVPSSRLYVRAVDRAGNSSGIREAWELTAKSPTGPAPSVRGDSNGDGRADVTAVLDHGFGRTGIWNVVSAGSTFYSGTMAWDTGEGTGFSLAKVKPVQGDFDGDGRTDMAVFRSGAGGRMWLYKLPSDGNEYQNPPAVWTTETATWQLNTARVVSGDVDGDGKDDIVVQNAGTGDNWQAQVFRAADDFAVPVNWGAAAAGNTWSRSAPLIVDIDKDGKADLLSVRNLTDCRTSVDYYRSTGTAFAAATTIYDSGAAGFCWDKSRFTVADPDGNGRDDVVALTENSSTDGTVVVFRSDGTTLTKSDWRRVTGLELAKMTLVSGDYDGDKLDDIGLLYAAGDGDREVYTLHSTGTSFNDKVKTWSGAVGAVTGPKFDIEHRQYELVNKNSGKCLNVDGSSVADNALFIQYTCIGNRSNERFRLMPIAGTDQYSIRPVHTAVDAGPVKCLSAAGGSSQDDTNAVQSTCGGGLGEPRAWEQVTFDYVDGSAYETVVHLRFAHSNKCLDVATASLDNGALIQQQECGQSTSEQWILRPAFNAQQLGGTGTTRYRVDTAVSTTTVLEVPKCVTTASTQLKMGTWSTASVCQKWNLKSLGDDMYKLIDTNSKQALEIKGCSKLPRATMIIFPDNTSECEKWRIEPTPGGTYSVISVSSGLSLDVANGSSAAGAEVISWFYHGGKGQRWAFKPL
ncbi:RICIN domain-containing protein [Kribbella sp. NBC_01505]|uniref:RICIN domain-containing protein n=1 Tax=Kribbella sp. NBC_01505 TaxID=2903580 RepID=UPI0038709118